MVNKNIEWKKNNLRKTLDKKISKQKSHILFKTKFYFFKFVIEAIVKKTIFFKPIKSIWQKKYVYKKVSI